MAALFTYIWPYITQFIPSLLDDEDIEPSETISLKIDDEFRENKNNKEVNVTPQKRQFAILTKSSSETIYLDLYLKNKTIKDKFFTKYKKYKSADDIFNFDNDDNDKPIGFITKVLPQGYYKEI